MHRGRRVSARLGVWLIAIAAIASIVVPVAVDWNDSHLFNPDWSPHARLHDAMSFLMSMGLGGAALLLLFTRQRRAPGDVALAAFLAVWSWAALLLAGFIPGAGYNNAAEDISPPVVAGVTILPNAALSVVLVAMGIAGWWLLRRERRS